MDEQTDTLKVMELINFKAIRAMKLAIDAVAQERSKPGDGVTASDVIRKAILSDPDIRRKYKQFLKS